MAWLNQAADEQMYISCLTIGEIQKGIALLKESVYKRKLVSYIEGLREAFAGRILNLTVEDCLLWGDLVAQIRRVHGTPPVIDSLLAAQALGHRLTIVTRNVKDFEQFDGLQIFCPWSN
jgi:hypothetical protein